MLTAGLTALGIFLEWRRRRRRGLSNSGGQGDSENGERAGRAAVNVVRTPGRRARPKQDLELGNRRDAAALGSTGDVDDSMSEQ